LWLRKNEAKDKVPPRSTKKHKVTGEVFAVISYALNMKVYPPTSIKLPDLLWDRIDKTNQLSAISKNRIIVQILTEFFEQMDRTEGEETLPKIMLKLRAAAKIEYGSQRPWRRVTEAVAQALITGAPLPPEMPEPPVVSIPTKKKGRVKK
jgi:hypothetical protein